MEHLTRIGLLALLGLGLGCGSDRQRPYDNNDLQLITGYTAKETCSCLFVMEQDEAFCRAWTRASPQVATWKADPEKKTVEAAAGFLWSARARFVSAREGCVVE